jgi:hypothetical protein
MYPSPIIVTVIISRNTKLVRCVACVGELTHTKLWSEHLKGRDHLEALGVDGTVISK